MFFGREQESKKVISSRGPTLHMFPVVVPFFAVVEGDFGGAEILVSTSSLQFRLSLGSLLFARLIPPYFGYNI